MDPGYAAWLSYSNAQAPAEVPDRVFIPGPVHKAALAEIRYAWPRIQGEQVIIGKNCDAPSVVIGTIDELKALGFEPNVPTSAEGFSISRNGGHIIVVGGGAEGVLYGVFTLLRHMALGYELECNEQPSAPIRFLNQWDNPDGSIERGYAGNSILYSDGTDSLITTDLARVNDYARLMASVGINGCCLNNVNANVSVYSDSGLPEIAKLAHEMEPYFVKPLIAIRFDSPKQLGGLTSYDPLNPEVELWWKGFFDKVYQHMPNLAGVVIKADSEGEAGPSADGRTHADAANMLGRAIAPHGGLVFYRGFVYNHKMDWQDLSLDRAKAQYDNFKPLDGDFLPNVTIQIKNGPIDFQVREPVSPSFAGLEKTNTVLELMVTQEYLGQQKHTVFEVPWWKDSLDFDFELPDKPSTLADIVTGKTYEREHFGFCAVSGVGRDENWLGNDLSMANLYGYGRLTWNPTATSTEIAEEWAGLTFNANPKVVKGVTEMLLKTWPAYEDYTGNFGIGGLTDIIHIHYGPSPISSEYNGWGQWHRSNQHGTGMNRTVATGTGMAGQYPSKRYENIETCPEDLLLFFHHVPYTHRLKNGQTLIQAMYDRHYRGAEAVEGLIEDWRTLRGMIGRERFERVLTQLQYQAGHAIVWRDSICHWFCRLSGIPDEKGRVFAEPNRIEADKMELAGFKIVNVEPWEAASGGKAIQIDGEIGEASFLWSEPSGVYDLWVWHYDTSDQASIHIHREDICLAHWSTSGKFPSTCVDAHTKTRRIIPKVEIETGQRIRIFGLNRSPYPLAIDFLEFKKIED